MRDRIGKQIDSLLNDSESKNCLEVESNKKIKRIVLCRLGGIGDVIHTLPLAKYLKKKYINASVEYVTASNVCDLLNEHCDFVDHTWKYDKKYSNKTSKEILSCGKEVDYFFNLHGSLRFFFFNLFHIKAKKYFHYKKDNSFHAVVNFAKTYNPLISAHELEPKVLSVNLEKDFLSTYSLSKNKYISLVLGVGKARPHRALAIENWVMLTKKILTLTDSEIKVVFLGGKDEKDLSSYFSSFGDRTVDLIGKLSLNDSSKIIAGSHSVISADTGLLHLAGALSKKVIGLFGPTLPERSGPFTSDFDVLVAKNCLCVGDLKKCKKKVGSGLCMESVSVEDIISKLRIGNLMHQ